jgi:hypothetical protein
MTPDYTTLTFEQIAGEFPAMARDAAAALGRLDAVQVNWKPDAARWSVAQCLEHLLLSNEQMLGAMEAAVDNPGSRTIWQRLPFAPRLLGRLMVSSLGPTVSRRFTAPTAAQPSASSVDPAIVWRFVDSQEATRARVAALAERGAGPVVMVSPYSSMVTYSVLDGCRLIVAHQRRHFEQARRVLSTPGFPGTSARA